MFGKATWIETFGLFCKAPYHPIENTAPKAHDSWLDFRCTGIQWHHLYGCRQIKGPFRKARGSSVHNTNSREENNTALIEEGHSRNKVLQSRGSWSKGHPENEKEVAWLHLECSETFWGLYLMTWSLSVELKTVLHWRPEHPAIFTYFGLFANHSI